jgi:succinate dehydrogenase / fumarate reductase cytochrome b subunit
VSILHRVSGALLFLRPCRALLFRLDQSLDADSAEGYAAAAGFFGQPLVKLLVLLLVWSYAHHFCAGIRYLLLEHARRPRPGVPRQPQRCSSWRRRQL